MKIVPIILSFFVSNILHGEKLSSKTPFYKDDSITIRGKVTDELGKPLSNVLILFSPFFQKKI
jgi:protocatechuate 3,4-dioxygenase beta subunit